MIEKIKAAAQSCEKEIINTRRHFHMNPEISWQEKETSERIAEELKRLGCENIKVGFGGTACGVSADITGGHPGKRVALRADIDALPLSDEKDAAYKSRKEGAMHACGHDAHGAMLLGAAKVLTGMKNELKGSVRLLFQPAEEHGIRPGARIMVEDKALEGVDAAFGLHVMSTVRSGEVRYRFGPFMAGADSWKVTLTGKGGHGAMPENAIDPTIAAFQIGNAIQTVVSREISPRDTAVISVGAMTTSSQVFNIIPDRVEMSGTVRTFLPEVQDRLEASVTRLIRGVGEAYRCEVDFTYSRLLPSTINEETTTALAKSVAVSLFGAENVTEAPMAMGSEDFSYFARELPATYMYLGTGNAAKKSDMPHHSPKFDVDESVLWQGAALYSAFAWEWLDKNRNSAL